MTTLCDVPLVILAAHSTEGLVGTMTEELCAKAKPVSIKRRFRLFDAMILVAATAIGCGSIVWASRTADFSLREVLDDVSSVFQESRGQIDAEGMISLCAMGTAVLTPMAVAWGLALLALRLVGPRPTWRRLARQPGMMAVCATVLVLAALGILIGCMALVAGMGSGSSSVVEDTLFLTPVFFGLAVAASWMTLIVGRRWRAERSWVDRAGRTLGIFHIVAGLLMIYLLALAARGSQCGIRVRSATSGPAAVVTESPAQPFSEPAETPSESASP